MITALWTVPGAVTQFPFSTGIITCMPHEICAAHKPRTCWIAARFSSTRAADIAPLLMA
jgi:hypothetical protein